MSLAAKLRAPIQSTGRSAKMALSVEAIVAIVAIVTLVVACPPAFIIIWKLYRRHDGLNNSTSKSTSKSKAHLASLPLLNIKSIDTTYELGVLPADNNPSSNSRLTSYMFMERRVEAIVVSSYRQLCKVSHQVIYLFQYPLTGDKHNLRLGYGRRRMTISDERCTGNVQILLCQLTSLPHWDC